MLVFFQAEDGIRDLVRSRGLGDVYKRQVVTQTLSGNAVHGRSGNHAAKGAGHTETGVVSNHCLLYTSDAADERSSVDLGGRRIIKKKKRIQQRGE